MSSIISSVNKVNKQSSGIEFEVMSVSTHSWLFGRNESKFKLSIVIFNSTYLSNLTDVTTI